MTRALRLLVHPGPVATERRESLTDCRGRAARLVLAPGKSLQEGLSAALAALGAASAAFTLGGGRFARLRYCIAAPNPDGPQVARYSVPHPAGRVLILGGGGAIGASAAGSPLVHCHAVMADEAGTPFGGHVLPEETIADLDDPPVLFARLYAEVAIRQRPDPETAMSIFHPAEVGHA